MNGFCHSFIQSEMVAVNTQNQKIELLQQLWIHYKTKRTPAHTENNHFQLNNEVKQSQFWHLIVY